MSARYQSGRFRLDIMQRVDSSFRQSSNATLIYNIPDVRAYFQTDLSVAYDFGADGQQMTAFLAIDNLFNEQGGLYQVPGYTGSPGMNYPVGPRADLIGRYFTLGVRFGGW
jgi:outer membrane receptor for Fe3+-dicitrate